MDDQTRLKQHLEHVAEHTDALTTHFYSLLDDRHPKLMDSFGPGSKQKTLMLTQILAAVHDSLYVDDAEWMALQLKALGTAHTRWRVTAPMYGQVNRCLLDALGSLPGHEWSEELEQIWASRLDAIAHQMHG